jgi:tRNA(adenine34) deaminase
MNSPVRSEQDQYWMGKALELARSAGDADEVPVGAILVLDDVIIGEGYNQPISAQDPSAHAEIMAIRAGARLQGNYRLPGTQLYSTMEPCPMCAGAIVHARIKRLVYAARDEKWGACGSLFDIPGCAGLNHKLQVQGGVMADESAELLRSFFKLRRG